MEPTESFNTCSDEDLLIRFRHGEKEAFGALLRRYERELYGYLRRYLETGEARIMGSVVEALARRKDGSVFPIDLSVSEARAGDDIVFIGVVRDRIGAREDKFFATVFRLLQEQLGERLDLPASAITEAVVDERLRPRAVPETLAVLVQELFQTCNLARYAPVKTTQELEAVIPKLEQALSQIACLN